MASVNVQSSWTKLKRKDLRQNPRYLVANGVLRVSWLDKNSRLKMAQVRVLNISERGMTIELPEEPQVNTHIRLQSEKHKVEGSAAVRHSRRVGGKYIIGVEFMDGLRWRPPEGDVHEP